MHTAPTVREALAALRLAAQAAPAEGAFLEMIIEVRDDPAVARSPDPAVLPDPMVVVLRLLAFQTTLDDGVTLRYPTERGLDLAVRAGTWAEVSRLLRHGSIDELRRDLADPRLEAEVYTAVQELANHYCDSEW